MSRPEGPRRPLRIPSWLGALLEVTLLVWIGVEILVGDPARATLAGVLLIIGRTHGPGKGSPPDDPENPR